MILLIKTDKQECFVGLHDGHTVISKHYWDAYRTLSDTLLKVIEGQIEEADVKWKDLTGIVIYKGPGSFTGLRIGITVANTLATSLEIPIAGKSGDEWIQLGINSINDGEDEKAVSPEYGGEANITQPKK